MQNTSLKHTSHPNFILGIISLLLLFVGIGLRANGARMGDYILIGSIGLGVIHWIWSVIDVFKHYHASGNAEDRNIIWVIIVIIVPPVGGILYYWMGRKVKI